jgi:AraC family transcriptional regulator
MRVREFLEAHPLEKIEMATLARVAERHPVHVSREFRRHFGKSLSQFVRERRLLRAAELMSCDGLPLAEVALQCGFYDQSHFTHAFRRLMGDSPAEYRSRRSVAQGTMRRPAGPAVPTAPRPRA